MNWYAITLAAHVISVIAWMAGSLYLPRLFIYHVGADHLREVGIPVMHDLPGVGENLQDHLEVYVQHACTQPVSVYSATQPWNKPWIGAQWLFFKEGPGATSHFEAGGFIRSRAGIEHPNLQYHFLPIAVNYDGSNPVKGHGFQAHVGPMRPTSRGYVRIRSKDPRKAPAILFNYMGTENDRLRTHGERASLSGVVERSVGAAQDVGRVELGQPVGVGQRRLDTLLKGQSGRIPEDGVGIVRDGYTGVSHAGRAAVRFDHQENDRGATDLCVGLPDADTTGQNEHGQQGGRYARCALRVHHRHTGVQETSHDYHPG